MDGKIDIYCEFGFLEKFCDACPQTIGVPHANVKMWSEYLDLLCGSTDIVITDINENDYRERCDESVVTGQILLMILQSHYDGKKNLKYLPNESKSMEMYEQKGKGKDYFKLREQTVFLMNRNKEECKKKEEDYGLLFISMDNYYEFSLLFSPDIQEINRDSIFWQCAKHYRHPCNTVILVDNFILKNDNEIIKKNLTSLFTSLLPFQLNEIPLKIHIFTRRYEDRTRRESENNQKNKQKSEIIQQCIKSLNRPYSESIETKIIFINEYSDHDRYLLTNYALFYSGYGFVLTDDQRQKGTSLSFFPITHLSSVNKENNVYRIVQNLRKRKNIK